MYVYPARLPSFTVQILHAEALIVVTALLLYTYKKDLVYDTSYYVY